MASSNRAALACVGLAAALAAAAAVAPGDYKGWGLGRERAQAKRRENPELWQADLFEADKGLAEGLRARPMAFGVFPAPRYDLVGKRSFRGAGNARAEHPWPGGRHVLRNAFFVLRSPVNERFLGGRADEVFFHVLVLSDRKVSPDGSDAFSQVVSRNHPHVAGQGQYKTAKAVIDYVAFQTADRNAYALVNMRLFDLRAGRVILVAPQKDGTLRSMQLEAPPLASADLKGFDARLLRDPRVVRFLNMPDNA